MSGQTDSSGYVKISLASAGTISGDQTFTGNVTIQGSLNFGDAGTDILTIYGYIIGHASGKKFVSIGNTSSTHTLTGTNDLVVGGNLEVDGAIYADGGLILNRTPINDAAYPAIATDYYICYTAISVSRTVTLPDAIISAGKTLVIKDESGSLTGVVTIVVDPEGATTIDGVANVTLETPYASLTVMSNGTNWFTVSRNYAVV